MRTWISLRSTKAAKRTPSQVSQYYIVPFQSRFFQLYTWLYEANDLVKVKWRKRTKSYDFLKSQNSPIWNNWVFFILCFCVVYKRTFSLADMKAANSIVFCAKEQPKKQYIKAISDLQLKSTSTADSVQ